MNPQDQTEKANRFTMTSQPASSPLFAPEYQIKYMPVQKQLFPNYNWFDRTTPSFMTTECYPSFNSPYNSPLFNSSFASPSYNSPSFSILNPVQASTTNKPKHINNSLPSPLKPHPCGEPNCSLFFRRIEHARRHRDGVHFKLKPHTCPFEQCGKKFARSDNLRQHIKSIHQKPSVVSI